MGMGRPDGIGAAWPIVGEGEERQLNPSPRKKCGDGGFLIGSCTEVPTRGRTKEEEPTLI